MNNSIPDLAGRVIGEGEGQRPGKRHRLRPWQNFITPRSFFPRRDCSLFSRFTRALRHRNPTSYAPQAISTHPSCCAMAGFSFPPPPPPPPKASAQDASSATNQTQPGAYGQRPGRGGGDRGRGRGRGRGNNNRSGFGRGGATNYHAPINQSLPYNQSLPQQQYASANGPSLHMATLPAGGYINPAFAPIYANAMNRAPPVSQPWLAQTPSNQTAGYQSATSTATSLPRPAASQRVPNKPKVQAAPPVPSFGFALPTVKPQAPAADNNNGSKSKKRKHNQLGLTPRSDMHEDSEEDDADEEARFKATGGALVQLTSLLPSVRS